MAYLLICVRREDTLIDRAVLSRDLSPVQFDSSEIGLALRQHDPCTNSAQYFIIHYLSQPSALSNNKHLSSGILKQPRAVSMKKPVIKSILKNDKFSSGNSQKGSEYTGPSNRQHSRAGYKVEANPGTNHKIETTQGATHKDWENSGTSNKEWENLGNSRRGWENSGISHKSKETSGTSNTDGTNPGISHKDGAYFRTNADCYDGSSGREHCDTIPPVFSLVLLDIQYKTVVKLRSDVAYCSFQELVRSKVFREGFVNFISKKHKFKDMRQRSCVCENVYQACDSGISLPRLIEVIVEPAAVHICYSW